MKLLVVSQYFSPENFRINDLVTFLVDAGHDVTVLTGQPNYPGGKFFSGYGWRGPRAETLLGARVLRVPLFPRGNGAGWRLALNYLTFAGAASAAVYLRLRRSERFDAIFVFETSPVTVGIPSSLARRRFGAPVLFWVLDLWPHSLSAVGAVRSPRILAAVGSLVGWIYRRCDRILVQSRSFAPEVERYGGEGGRIRFFPNWGEAVFDSGLPPADVPKDLAALPPGFRIMYAGNIGAAQDFPALVEAAKCLRQRRDIHWVIVGDGRMGDWARAEVRRCGLEHTVYFLGQKPLEVMPAYLGAADALLLSLRADPVFALTVPGKLQSYLAAGKPVLALLDGAGAAVLEEAQAGFAVPSGDAAGLASAAARLAGMTLAERDRLGRNGRDYYEANFARDRVFANLAHWLEEAVAERRREAK